MGAASSRNTIENHLSQSLDIASSAIQDCSSSINADQKFVIKTKGSIDLQDINLKQMVTFSSSCLQSTDLESKIDSSLLQHMQQAADSAVKGWGIGFASASNTTRNYTDLALAISNEFKQNCRNEIQATQLVDLESEGNVTIAGFNADQTIGAVRDCIQNSKAVSGIVNKTVQEVEQKASAAVTGLDLGMLIALIAGVIVVIVLSVVLKGSGGGGSGNGGGGTSWTSYLIGFILFALVVGGGISYYLYQKQLDEDKKDEPPKPTDKCVEERKKVRPECKTKSDCKSATDVCSFGWCVPADCSADACFEGCASHPGSQAECDASRGMYWCKSSELKAEVQDSGLKIDEQTQRDPDPLVRNRLAAGGRGRRLTLFSASRFLG